MLMTVKKILMKKYLQNDKHDDNIDLDGVY